jgi:translation initiation factor 4E
MMASAVEEANFPNERNTTDSQVDLSTIPISPAGDSGKAGKTDAAGDITVFHDKDNFNVKHPLMNKWTLWFTKPPTGRVARTKLGWFVH